jgi:chromosome segregation ATPase
VEKADLEAAATKRRIRKKKYDKEQDYVEQLEKEIRELKSINRSLLKQIKKLSKGINRQEYEEALEVVENGKEKEQQVRRKNNRSSDRNSGSGGDCPACGKGWIREIDINGRVFGRCDTCEHRTKRIR